MNRSFTRPTPSDKQQNSGEKINYLMIGGLLNMLEHPAICIDSLSGEIVLANQNITEVTAFSKSEIVGKTLADLLEVQDVQNIYRDGNTPVRILRRKRAPADFVANSAPIDLSRQHYVIVFRPVMNIIHDIQNKQSKTFEAFSWLVKAINLTDINDALNLVMDSIAVLFNTDMVCIYQAESEFPRLRKVVFRAGGAEFPSTLPSSDMIRLGVTTIWTPGKRVNTELHRVGRIAELEYLATVPLGENNAGFGLLVVGDQYNPPADTLGELLELIAAVVKTIFQQNLLVSGLRDLVSDMERKQLVHSEIFAGVQDGVIIVSPGLLVVDINPMTEWLFGYAPDEVCGKTVDNILIGHDRIMPALEAAFLGEPTNNLGDCVLHRRNGQSFPARIRMIPVEKDNAYAAVLIFVNDMSDVIESQRNYQQLENRAILGDFTAIFAHDLRNPINNISTGMQLMVSRLSADDPNLVVVNRVLGDCTRIDHLMEAVLTFSRSMEPKLEPVDINQFVSRLLDRWRPMMVRGNVQSVLQVEENLPAVAGDPRLLDRLFTNLINNALDAMKITEGGTLAVKVGLKKQINHTQVEIAVSDTGPGIPEEVRRRMFEPFVTTKQTGTGLGLAISKRIVTVHKGTINCESFPGGTVFWVLLPAYEGAS